MGLSAQIWNLGFIAIVCTNFVFLTSGSQYTFTTKCDKTNRGQRQLYRNIVGDDKPAICLARNGVYRWAFLDGSPTVGEIFDPAKDCSDIVDGLPNAKDGFYWILTKKGTPIKVWCDLHTDGGGFMLIGMLDSPTTWAVPSNSKPVDPKGPPHWSSAFGGFDVLDLAIQVSDSAEFEGTKAHWLYRLSPARHLGNLFMKAGKGGCLSYQPGIGNISYVKDILTDVIVTRNFRCSMFTQAIFSYWTKINQCLQQDCPKGYAFRSGIFSSRQIDKYGSFSYSRTPPRYGKEDTVAFVGCDNGKCCACFGPKGGRLNYCRSPCVSINGGTVTKKAFAWFWIRTRKPKRVWKSCMEFKMKKNDGGMENYFINAATGIAQKGSCSKQLNTLMNEGTILSTNKDSLESIPPVPGLLSYRSDIKQLYVNTGSQWDALSSKKEIQALKDEVKYLQIAFINLQNPRSCMDIKNMNLDLPSGSYPINPQGKGFSPFNVYCDMTSKNGIGVTVIGHNSEKSTIVEKFWSYQRNIAYDVTMDRIEAIIKTSKHCEQFIKYRCYHSRITRYAWWVSRQGSKMNYWGGAAVNSGKCKCGITNSCAGGGNCNCDAYDKIWREDSGLLTDKKTLPVTELHFGDALGKIFQNYGYHTLGKLLCYG